MAASGIASGELINDAFNICEWSDQQIETLLDDIYRAATNGGTVNIGGQEVDPQNGAGALMIDRMMSELSNLESISANAVATSQRIMKEINSKLS